MEEVRTPFASGPLFLGVSLGASEAIKGLRGEVLDDIFPVTRRGLVILVNELAVGQEILLWRNDLVELRRQQGEEYFETAGVVVQHRNVREQVGEVQLKVLPGLELRRHRILRDPLFA